MAETAADRFLPALREWVETAMRESMQGHIAYMRESGFSMSQMGALFFLHKAGQCGMSNVVEHLGISNAAASQLLDRLVQQRLVNRSEDPSDRRAKLLSLTEEGERVMAESFEARQRWITRLTDELSESERAQATAALSLLTTKLKDLQGRKR